jgi:hypothetical protein
MIAIFSSPKQHLPKDTQHLYVEAINYLWFTMGQQKK